MCTTYVKDYNAHRNFNRDPSGVITKFRDNFHRDIFRPSSARLSSAHGRNLALAADSLLSFLQSRRSIIGGTLVGTAWDQLTVPGPLVPQTRSRAILDRATLRQHRYSKKSHARAPENFSRGVARSAIIIERLIVEMRSVFFRFSP